MKTLGIKDLPDSQELDHQAMSVVRGGFSLGLQSATQTAITTADTGTGSESKAKPPDFHFIHYFDKSSAVLG